MREGLDAPTLELPAASVAEIRAFLDGQSRLELAVWVRHEQQGVDGPMHDHHLVLGVDDRDWETGDMRALEDGMELPPLRLREPTWIDLYPVSEVEPLRAFGTVLWEGPGGAADDLDPLDFRLVYEPLGVPAAIVQALAAQLRALPEISRLEASRERLWKNDREVRSRTQFWVGFDGRRPGDWEQLERALHGSGLVPTANWGLSAGLPGEDQERVRTAVLYER